MSSALAAYLVDAAPFIAQQLRETASLLGRLTRYTYTEERIWRAEAATFDSVGGYVRSPLMHAALTGNLARLEWLLVHGHGHGARVNALAHAVQKSWKRCAPRALHAVSALSLAEDAEDSPVRDAIVAALIDAGAKTFDELSDLSAELLVASLTGDVDELRRLRAAGADVNDVFAEEENGPTPLIVAARGGHVAAIHLLCDLGAQTSAYDNSVEDADHGLTPLLAALEAGHLAAAEALLECGADPDGTTYGNDTMELGTLAYAVKYCSSEAALMLLRYGASANVFESSDDGITLLHTAAMRGDLPLAKALLEGGADVNSRELCWTHAEHVRNDEERLTVGCGPTPLILAAREGHLNVIRALCAGGAHLESTDNSARSGSMRRPRATRPSSLPSKPASCAPLRCCSAAVQRWMRAASLTASTSRKKVAGTFNDSGSYQPPHTRRSTLHCYGLCTGATCALCSCFCATALTLACARRPGASTTATRARERRPSPWRTAAAQRTATPSSLFSRLPRLRCEFGVK